MGAQATAGPTTVGYLLSVAAGVLWATTVLFGRLLVDAGVDPLMISAVRATLAFAILGGAHLVSGRRPSPSGRTDLGLFALSGLCLALNFTLFFVSLEHTSGAIAVSLLYTYPAIVALLAATLLGERLTGTKVLALAMALVGCFLASQGYDPEALRLNLPGILAGLGAALALAGYHVMAKVAVGRCDSSTVVLRSFGFAALYLLVYQAGDLPVLLALPGRAWGGLILLAVFPTFLAYSLFVRALSYIEVSRATLACSVEPAAAATLAWLLLGERTGSLQWLGVALITAEVVVIRLSETVRRNDAGANRGAPAS